MKTLSIPAFVALLASAAPAQDICQGNGVGGAYIETGPAYIGGPFEHDVGSPNVPFGTVFFVVSDGFDVTPTPPLGDMCMDTASSALAVFALPADATGNVHFALNLPADPSLAAFPGIFCSNAITFEGGEWSISKTTALHFQNANAWAPTENMGQSRFHHTATALYADGRDNEARIFVAGGSTGGTVTVPSSVATTEIYSPLDRSFTPGPRLSVPRAVHTATRLADGRVLIAGGMDALGVCHRTCEIFDPATLTMTPTGDMSVERASHTATLLADGRVLVTGGLQDWQGMPAGFKAGIESAHASAELYDPASGTWSPAQGIMSSIRSGHSATLLDDGTVLIAGGAYTASTSSPSSPSFTSSVDRFDPATDSFVPQAPLALAVGFHGASRLGGGDVLITGGFMNSSGTGTETAFCQRWDGSAWTQVGYLMLSRAWHEQIELDDGSALIVGGLSASLAGTNFAGRHDGTTYTELADIGLNPGLPGAETFGLGAATLTRGYDGGYVLLGGVALDSLFAPGSTGERGWVYTPEL